MCRSATIAVTSENKVTPRPVSCFVLGETGGLRNAGEPCLTPRGALPQLAAARRGTEWKYEDSLKEGIGLGFPKLFFVC